MDVQLFESVLQHDAVHDGRQHANVISGRAVHAARAFRDAAKNVAAADNHGNFDSQIMHLLDLLGHHPRHVNVDTECLFADQRFAGNLQKDAPKGRGLLNFRSHVGYLVVLCVLARLRDIFPHARAHRRKRSAHTPASFATSPPKSSSRLDRPSPIL